MAKRGNPAMSKRIITVGHSPDPDDAFMFYALAHDKIDTGDLKFRHELQDIETLNRRALKGELEVTAISLHAYSYLLDKYALLPSGCSMGDRYGPMVVAKKPLQIEQLKDLRIAVPGTMTTATVAVRRCGVCSARGTRPALFQNPLRSSSWSKLDSRDYKRGRLITRSVCPFRVWLFQTACRERTEKMSFARPILRRGPSGE